MNLMIPKAALRRMQATMHGNGEKLRAIPVGRTVTYMELARWISPLPSPRAVGNACAANPIALAIPCHASCAAMAISRVTAGASSASVS